MTRKHAVKALRDRLEYIKSLVSEDLGCPHCIYIQQDLGWEGFRPSHLKTGQYVRACRLHRAPKFPKINQYPAKAEEMLTEQLDKRLMVAVDWQALEDQL